MRTRHPALEQIEATLVTKVGCEICGKEFATKRQLSGHRIGKRIRKLGLKNAHIKVGHLTAQQKGYLAAFLDGEGGIQITRTFRKNREYKLALHPTVYFCNTNLEVIQTMKKWLTVGFLVTRVEKGRHKDTHVLHITGTRNILKLLTCLSAYLIVKKRQAQVMVEYCKSRTAHYRGGDRRFSNKELELYTALTKLNVKGVIRKRQPTEV